MRAHGPPRPYHAQVLHALAAAAAAATAPDASATGVWAPQQRSGAWGAGRGPCVGEGGVRGVRGVPRARRPAWLCTQPPPAQPHLHAAATAGGRRAATSWAASARKGHGRGRPCKSTAHSTARGQRPCTRARECPNAATRVPSPPPRPHLHIHRGVGVRVLAHHTGPSSCWPTTRGGLGSARQAARVPHAAPARAPAARPRPAPAASGTSAPGPTTTPAAGPAAAAGHQQRAGPGCRYARCGAARAYPPICPTRLVTAAAAAAAACAGAGAPAGAQGLDRAAVRGHAKRERGAGARACRRASACACCVPRPSSCATLEPCTLLPCACTDAAR